MRRQSVQTGEQADNTYGFRGSPRCHVGLLDSGRNPFWALFDRLDPPGRQAELVPPSGEKSAEAIAANSLAARAAAGQTIRRRAANLPSKQADRPASTRAAGHGGSSNTMMRLYTQDDHVGLRVIFDI
ncbi:hypothetical protein PSHT_12930 [Puccinia striiformis]|uniref:Uncharacterized protein n=1 Tax=Puccinia striiformis TaxID=27350 RepID=A0A2S4UU38_9BASI|nr:hypothetical protein PSHT_12930 [Puccinia striiformis]